MTEGSLYDRELAALAIKQARGDLVEAIFLLRAYRTTLARFGASQPLDTTRITLRRRVSATFKDVPGGQILGPTFDYTHRLLDFSLAVPAREPEPRHVHAEPASPGSDQQFTSAPPRVVDVLDREGLIEPERTDEDSRTVGDITR